MAKRLQKNENVYVAAPMLPISGVCVWRTTCALPKIPCHGAWGSTVSWARLSRVAKKVQKRTLPAHTHAPVKPVPTGWVRPCVGGFWRRLNKKRQKKKKLELERNLPPVCVLFEVRCVCGWQRNCELVGDRYRPNRYRYVSLPCLIVANRKALEICFTQRAVVSFACASVTYFIHYMISIWKMIIIIKLLHFIGVEKYEQLLNSPKNSTHFFELLIEERRKAKLTRIQFPVLQCPALRMYWLIRKIITAMLMMW